MSGGDGAIDRALERMVGYHRGRFEKAEGKRDPKRRRVGLELKFPIVTAEGEAAPWEIIDTFWGIIEEDGWDLKGERLSEQVREARGGDPDRPDLIQTTTGRCVLEFSVGHEGNLAAMDRHLARLREYALELREQTGAVFLCLGTHPVTLPSPDLMAKKSRHMFWDDVAPPREADPRVRADVSLFTTIADNQVHLDIDLENATTAVNVLNALAPVQLALTAGSKVWDGEIDEDHWAVREVYWDWWLGEQARYGIPARRFTDFADYCRAIGELRPVYADREGVPYSLAQYASFLHYLSDERPSGRTVEGDQFDLDPTDADIDLHDRAFWWNARLSRYCTIESRVSCQQPPDALLAPAAFVMGIVEELETADNLTSDLPWDTVKDLRSAAIRQGLGAFAAGTEHAGLPARVLDLAEAGLRRRALGEEEYLEPLKRRLETGRVPADESAEVFADSGVRGLIDQYAWA